VVDKPLHGLSVFGDLAEPNDFKAFGYVRADAPRGGSIAQEMYGTFNSLNAYILRGDSAFGLGLCFDSLMTSSLDERDALYGLVAKSVTVSQDRRELRFELRREAKFNDGTPLTAKDVVFSLEILKAKGHPTIQQELRDLESVMADGHDVVVHLADNHSRELPLIVARQPIFSAAYYSKKPFDETTLDPPLGSGPYKVGHVDPGRNIAYDRVPDYWGAKLPVNVGQNNFDHIRFEYFSDRNVAFEAFKAGAFTVHEEFTSAIWAKGYDFPAFTDGRVKREEIPDDNISGVQGWFFNIRRPAFADPKVRQAIGAAFDFNWTNANLMYGSYKRTVSYFENSDMEARGLPDAKELALLQPFADKLPKEVFGEPFIPPQSDGSGQDRTLLKQSMELLASAGLVRDGQAMKTADGQPISIEFLDFSSALERHTQPFIKNLRLIGIDAHMRVVDAAQYRQRLENFDFDIVTQRLTMSFSPGEELRALFGSDAAKIPGSRNLVGISDPVVDALVSQALVATSRDDLVHICRALDRVLRAGRYWVPHWYKPSHWIAEWDVFGRPARAPKFDPGILSTWWYEPQKAAKVALPER
jgi:microcin C transport system substrate-binding protein